jgi:hypothetical protein
MVTGDGFLRVRQQWHEADNSPTPNAEVKVWSYSSTPSCLLVK